MNKTPQTIVAFLGVIYGGNYYIPLDEEMPRFRIDLILETLDSPAIICDGSTKGIVESLNFKGQVWLYEEIVKTRIDEGALASIRQAAIDTDPIYVVFTSGSTGIPKGVVACHRSVLDYIEA